MKRFKWLIAISLTFVALIPTPAFAATYTDIAGHTDEAYITEYSSYGLVSGYPDGTFRPDATITRAETVALLDKLELYPITQKDSSFTDVLPTDWFYPYIDSAVKSGVVSGYEGNIFLPQNEITRFEAISIVSRLVRSENYNSVQLPYSDSEDIPLWVNTSVRNLHAAGVIDTYPENKINGSTHITRAEMVRMLDKAMRTYDFDTSRVSQTTLENYTNPQATATEIPHDILGYLTIESIGISKFPVKDGADLETIKTAIGHFSETPIWDGNVGFCAHNRDYKYDFRNLKNIAVGDTVTYETRFGTRNYQVTVIKPIAETDWSDITAAVEQNTLTMVTCIEDQPTKRFLVQAVQK